MNITEEHIDWLHTLAHEAMGDRNHSHTQEYVHLARRVAEWNHCGLPRAFRRFSCDNCGAYPHFGVNVRIRTRTGGHIIVRHDCGATKHYPY